MIIKITRHAKQRMTIKGITRGQVKRAIKMGATTKQTDGYESHYTYYSICWKMTGKDIYRIKTVKIKN